MVWLSSLRVSGALAGPSLLELRIHFQVHVVVGNIQFLAVVGLQLQSQLSCCQPGATSGSQKPLTFIDMWSPPSSKPGTETLLSVRSFSHFKSFFFPFLFFPLLLVSFLFFFFGKRLVPFKGMRNSTRTTSFSSRELTWNLSRSTRSFYSSTNIGV